MQKNPANFLSFLRPRGVYALYGILSLLGLWREGFHAGALVLFGGVFLLCAAQFVKPAPLGWAVFLLFTCFATALGGVALLSGTHSRRSLFLFCTGAGLTALLCLARPARPAQPR